MQQNKLGLASKEFADKVKAMNQRGSHSILLTETEARNLLNDLFDLLAKIAELSSNKEETSRTVDLKGGKF